MSYTRWIATGVITSTCLIGSQTTLAFNMGGTLVHGSITNSQVTYDDGFLPRDKQPLEASDEHDLTYRGGYRFIGQKKVEQDLPTAGGPTNDVNHLSVNLVINHYSPNGLESSALPYVGTLLNYTHFDEEQLATLNLQHSYEITGQLGVDLAVALG
ncbi:MAG: OmpW family outer membrane protein, partial [Pseudohongiellaceae bacterium]